MVAPAGISRGGLGCRGGRGLSRRGLSRRGISGRGRFGRSLNRGCGVGGRSLFSRRLVGWGLVSRFLDWRSLNRRCGVGGRSLFSRGLVGRSLVGWGLVCGLLVGRSGDAGGIDALVLGSLVAQGRQPVGQVPGQGLHEPGQLLQRSGHGPGKLRQQDLPGRQIGQRRGLRGPDDLLAEEAALDHQQRVGPREVAKSFGHCRGVAGDEGDTDRTDQHLFEGIEAGPFGRQANQGVLVDPVLATARAQRPAQTGEVLDLQAPVLGENRGVRLAKEPPDLVDDRHLLGSRVVHRSPLSHMSPTYGRHRSKEGHLSPRRAGPWPT